MAKSALESWKGDLHSSCSAKRTALRLGQLTLKTGESSGLHALRLLAILRQCSQAQAVAQMSTSKSCTFQLVCSWFAIADVVLQVCACLIQPTLHMNSQRQKLSNFSLLATTHCHRVLCFVALALEYLRDTAMPRRLGWDCSVVFGFYKHLYRSAFAALVLTLGIAACLCHARVGL